LIRIKGQQPEQWQRQGVGPEAALLSSSLTYEKAWWKTAG